MFQTTNQFYSGVYTFQEISIQHASGTDSVPPHGLEPSPDLFQQSFSKLNWFRFLTERAFSEMMTRRSLSNVWIILSGWWFQPL